jgi:hypothetical protein
MSNKKKHSDKEEYLNEKSENGEEEYIEYLDDEFEEDTTKEDLDF